MSLQFLHMACGHALARSSFPVPALWRRIGFPKRHSKLISCNAYTVRKGEDEGETMLELSTYLTDRVGSSAPGVYAIYSSDRVLQFIGFGKDIFKNMQEHMDRVSEDQRKFVRAKVFANASMATQENMAREAQHWVEEEGGVLPPGNGVDAKQWTLSEGALGGLSSGASQATTSGTSDGDVMVSPFTQAQVHRSVGQVKGEGLEMTVATVDKALDEVRPYLRADGGDVDVVKVEDGNIYLRLEGRCNTCASSSATMSMGIERALRAAFGDKLNQVIQVDQGPQGATKQAVDELLNLLRPAITSYNGKVEVVSVEGGVCRVVYQGPEPIWVGVRAAIRDKFEDITEVQRCESVASTNGTE